MRSADKFVLAGALLLAAGLVMLSGCSDAPETAEDEATYVARIEEHRRARDEHYRTTKFSAFGLLRRHYFDTEPRLTIGSAKDAGLRIDDKEVSPLHAVIEGLSPTPMLTAKSRMVEVENPAQEITEVRLKSRTGFRIGRFHLRFNVSKSGRRNVEVYDPAHANAAAFESLDYFTVDTRFRVTGTIVPHDNPEKIKLIDSQDGVRDYYLFGELRFPLEGGEYSLELYTRSLDPEQIARDRHMLLFRDLTSGKDTYPAARYLYLEGKTRGEVEVDFNLAFNPSCNYSFVYECPLPRPKNVLKVAIRAGEKYYKKHSVKIPLPNF